MFNLKYKKVGAVILTASLLGLTACGQSPVRNPFEKRAEPELSALPEMKSKDSGQHVAKVTWTKKGKENYSLYNKIRPIIFENSIYAASDNGLVSALNFSNGKEVWSHKIGLNITAGPVVIDNQLIVTAKQFVVSLDRTTGVELWRQSVSSEVVSMPGGQGQMVVVNALDGSVSALNSRNGEILWRVNHSVPALTLRTKSAPVVSQDKVLVGLSSGRLVALNLYSGMIEWEYTLVTSRGRSELQRMVDISADPVVIGNTVYVIAYQGKLAALDLESGQLNWERNISAHENMVYDQTALYITDDEHNLWSIDRQTGVTLWRQNQLATRYITNPSLYQGHIVVADRGGYVHWLDTQTGHLQGRAEVGEKFYQAPVAANDFLLVSQQNGKLSRVDLPLDMNNRHKG